MVQGVIKVIRHQREFIVSPLVVQLTDVAMHRTHGPPRSLKCAQIASNGPKGDTQQHNPETRRFWVRFA